jgi:hypothetical protein
MKGQRMNNDGTMKGQRKHVEGTMNGYRMDDKVTTVVDNEETPNLQRRMNQETTTG